MTRSVESTPASEVQSPEQRSVGESSAGASEAAPEVVFAPARPWRASVAIGEGLRSALNGRWLSAAMTLLVCWVAAAPGAVDAATVSDLVAEERRFLEAGGNAVHVSNERAGVPALTCERIAGADGVRASAALTRLPEPATPSVARGGDVAVFAVSTGIWALLGAEASLARDAVVPASLAERLGLVDGDWLVLEPSPGTLGERLPRQPVRVTVADTAVLGEAYTGVLLPTVTNQETVADVCVVVADPAQLPLLRDTLPAVLDPGSGQTVVADRLITGEP